MTSDRLLINQSNCEFQSRYTINLELLGEEVDCYTAVRQCYKIFRVQVKAFSIFFTKLFTELLN